MSVWQRTVTLQNIMELENAEGKWIICRLDGIRLLSKESRERLQGDMIPTYTSEQIPFPLFYSSSQPFVLFYFVLHNLTKQRITY